MGRRLDRTAGRLGIDPPGRALLRRAFELGMVRRFEHGFSDHHPDYLHPARTALILMDDARVDRVPVLAAALVTETRDLALRVPDGELAALGPDAAAVARAVVQPAAAGDRLLEELLASPADARLVAVAERLDHARHLHLRPAEEWDAYHEATCRAYAPLAGRTDPALAARLGYWCSVFRRRYGAR